MYTILLCLAVVLVAAGWLTHLLWYHWRRSRTLYLVQTQNGEHLVGKRRYRRMMRAEVVKNTKVIP